MGFIKGYTPWNKSTIPLKDRILPKILKLENGCWQWIAGLSGKKYGAIGINGKQMLAHRVIYELFVSPIPEGLTLDHLCKNTRCVNPHHLEPVTIGVNVLRGGNPAAVNKRKTHCKNGHEFNEDNTYINPCNNQRVCKLCYRTYRKIWDNNKKVINK